MAKKMRTINNPLDRQTRNDINYNFGVLDNALEDMVNSEAADNERFVRIENDVVKLKNEDKNLSDRIDANKQAIEDMDLEAIKLQGEIAEQQGIEAKKKGDKAEQQGNVSEQKGNVAEEQGVVAETKGIKAEQQGNYAKEMGDYAKEKAEYASAKTAEIEQAHTDLSQIKVEAVDATQSANTQADYAKEQGDYAKSVGDEVSDKLSDIEDAKDTLVSEASDAIETVIEKGNITEQQGLKAKEQGDYAQSVIDSYKHVGDWQGSVEYKKNQEVLFNGSTYRALEDNKGTQPTDKTIWQLIAQRGVDGEGAVGSVNGIMPDSDGNVDLGDIADKQYVDDKIGDVDFSALETKADAESKFEEAKAYTDEKIGDVDLSALETKIDAQAKLEESKQYTDEQISAIPEVDLSPLETKEDAQAKLEESKKYTDDEIAKIPEVDTSEFVTKKRLLMDGAVPSGVGESVLIGKGNGGWSLEGRIIHSIYTMGENNRFGSSNSWVFGTGNKVKVSSDFPSFVVGTSNEIDASFQSVVYVLGSTIKINNNNVANNPGATMGAVTVMGMANKGRDDYIFHYGNGNFNGSRRSDALAITEDGDLLVQGDVETYGADYAEMFEWEDGNPDNEDRVGLAVTWGEGESIKLANAGDEVIGIISATAAILGDNPMDWDKRFVTDQFGRRLRKEYTIINEDGEEETYEWFVENPEYDPKETFVPRNKRPEWAPVGLLGKLYWIDDGTLEVGDYATIGKDGTAVKGDKSNGWRVMKRISNNVDGDSGIVKVFFK